MPYFIISESGHASLRQSMGTICQYIACGNLQAEMYACFLLLLGSGECCGGGERCAALYSRNLFWLGYFPSSEYSCILCWVCFRLFFVISDSSVVVVVAKSAWTVASLQNDSIFPHVSGWTAVVVANLVQPSLVRKTWTTLPRRLG